MILKSFETMGSDPPRTGVFQINILNQSIMENGEAKIRLAPAFLNLNNDKVSEEIKELE